MSHKKLLKIYTLFDTWAKDFEFACQKGCSTCCTQSVSMTRLEGELIFEYIKSEKPELLKTIRNLPTSDLSPITTNQFAAACLQEKMPEDTEETWDMTPCVFLKDSCCAIYPVRSFMCRSLGSRVLCDLKGEAEMDPLFLTLNTVILQCIEHLDQGRPWGNMNIILQMVAADHESSEKQKEKGIRISQPIPGFLIPPEEINQVENQLKILLRIVNYP